MNELTVFESEQFGSVRTVTRDGEPWFVAADVCKALEIHNAADAIKRLDDDERMTIDSTEGHSGQRGGAQSMNIINEPGLYSLVLGSRKPEARAFKRWITHDVIPSIRKTGKYQVICAPNMNDKVLIVEAAARMLNMNDASKILMLDRFCRQEGVDASFLPRYEDNGGKQLIAATTLLKEFNLGMTAVKFNQAMVEAGYLEERERESSKGMKKRFKALTEKGCAYGENQISPQNPREVQPLYYRDSFMDLFRKVVGFDARS